MTGDDWGNICRHLMKDSGDGAVGIAIFFIIYQVQSSSSLLLSSLELIDTKVYAP